MSQIPLFNLQTQHNKLKHQILKSWGNLIDSSEFTAGKDTQQFENTFAIFCQTKYALGVRSGTAALIVALKAAGINSGDEVITTPMTFSATADAIALLGATPVFVDILPETGNINPDLIKKKITTKTKAILIVHLYGVPCEMDEIISISKQHNLKVIEDASHAHGSVYKGKSVGSFGIAGCFSLYPSKTLGTLGNAGIITTNSLNFLHKCKMFAHHGIKEDKYVHHLIGFNELIDNIQASALLIKMESLAKRIERKKRIVKLYNRAFQSVGQKGMHWSSDTDPSFYVYAVQVTKRDKFQKYMEKKGISTGVYYPTPLHLQPSYKYLLHKQGEFPQAEHFANQTVSLPLYPELTDLEINNIQEAIIKFYS